jgi:hypothetical protein
VVRVTGSFGKLCRLDQSLGLFHGVGDVDNDCVVDIYVFLISESPFTIPTIQIELCCNVIMVKVNCYEFTCSW